MIEIVDRLCFGGRLRTRYESHFCSNFDGFSIDVFLNGDWILGGIFLKIV